MNFDVMRAFKVAMEKEAVSAARTLALLQARAGQGARVAPKLMQQAQTAAASGAASTAPGMRRLALSAGQDARAATGAATLAARSGVAPQRAALQQRAATGVGGLTLPFQGKMLRRTYSRPGMDYMAGQLPREQAVGMTSQARKFMQAPSAVPRQASNPRVTTEGTVVAKRRRAA